MNKPPAAIMTFCYSKSAFTLNNMLWLFGILSVAAVVVAVPTPAAEPKCTPVVKWPAWYLPRYVDVFFMLSNSKKKKE